MVEAVGGPIALCLGGATTVWAELAAAEALIGDRDRIIVACNFAGLQYRGDLDGWATLHPERFAAWRETRAARGGNIDYRAFIHADHPRCPDAEVVATRWRGSSGLYMAQVALEAMEAGGAILCGAPMDGSGDHIHWPGKWTASARYQPGFEAARAAGVNIRSMGGWTRKTLGAPDAAWLADIGVGPRRPAIERRYFTAEDPAMRVRFLKDFDYVPGGAPRTLVAYRAGTEHTVKREAGEAAIAKGHAVRIAVPRRKVVKPDG
ncbi:MAG: hypothetical protein GC145_06220 [Caulobacter sp.]|nr:hypothetical protein [Caulobacter sp.]